MAQVVPQPAAGAAAAPQAIQQPPTTYSARFANMGALYEGAYLPFLAAYEPNAQLQPATVRQTALTLAAHGGLPGVYAYQVPGTGHIRTIHRLSQTTPLPGLATPWDGVVFAFEGDVEPPNLINLVQVPAQAFYRTTAVTAPTAATLSGHWAGVADATPCMGPFDPADADTTQVVTRRFMPVPYAYVQYMHDRVLTPRQAWQIAEQVIADGRAADCEVFIDFLRVACTYRAPAAAGDPLTASTMQDASLVVPLADGALRRQIWNWLVSDLPALATPVPGPVENQFAATAATVRQELELARANAEAARAEAKAPKTITDAYPTIAPLLRRLCGVDSDAELPVFWIEYATTGGKKHQALACLQQLVSNRANDPSSARCHIVVSVALAERIFQFRLGAPDPDEITEGASIFLVVPQHYYLAAGTRLECNTYGMLTSGSGAASMSDIRELSDPKIQAPRDALELSCFVGGYSCLIDVLLGENHGAAARLRNHASFWQQNAPALASMVGQDQLKGFLMRIMRTIQLVSIDYINLALQHGTAAALPDYSRIEDAVRHRTWQNLSQLPPRYLTEPPPGTKVPSAVSVLSPITTASASSQPPSSTTSHTTISTKGMSTRAEAPKTHQNADWLAKFASSEKEVKDLKADESRPKYCLSYHLRGTCFEACRESATHRALTTSEKKSMQEFLDKAL